MRRTSVTVYDSHYILNPGTPADTLLKTIYNCVHQRLKLRPIAQCSNVILQLTVV